ncbi:SDR family NAD(P)-dependent oxidoreductase [Nocardia cyriacigeorgica]|uniref:SDR family NAD(P)-dependent oxidoreductase n=1 Tax=Nocardia cyriacigeorgica TaxID=135487 RepID=UPI00189554C3|nr:SDR family NAD(P)-dependent oxidoreductase [Nocardia cyriacigeorgica]MBF6427828.1 SDR family NAD(P)-dependent oxidoreductase [Nocardia cyriacigeorgica]
MGTSFGRGHAIATAAGDAPIAAAITQCPFTGSLAYSLVMPFSTRSRLTAFAIRDLIGARLGRQPVMVCTYGPRGSTALMNAPDCAPRHACSHSRWNGDTERDGRPLHAADHSQFLGRQVRHLVCPILFAISEYDSVAPAGSTQKYAATGRRERSSSIPSVTSISVVESISNALSPTSSCSSHAASLQPSTSLLESPCTVSNRHRDREVLMSKPWNLRGKSILFTGGSERIGAAAAQAVTKRGANFVLVDLSEEALVNAARRLPSAHTTTFVADVTDGDAMVAAVRPATEWFGGIDVVLANAGNAPNPVTTVRRMAPEVFERIVEVDLLGVY